MADPRIRAWRPRVPGIAEVLHAHGAPSQAVTLLPPQAAAR